MSSKIPTFVETLKMIDISTLHFVLLDKCSVSYRMIVAKNGISEIQRMKP